MTFSKAVATFFLSFGLATGWAAPIIASEPYPSTMANYIQNARTADDHEYISAVFRQQATMAQTQANRYSDQFTCQHSKTMELQRRRPVFAGVAAQRHCREALRHYTNEARENEKLADQHRKIADELRARSLY